MSEQQPAKHRGVADKVQALLEPVLAHEGFELVEVEFVSDRGRAVLRLYIDRLSNATSDVGADSSPGQGGVHVDDCARVSRVAGDLLDVEEAVPGAYHLEVSSPGLYRPLRKKVHFERVVGERIKVKTFAKIDGRKVFTGTLSRCEDESLHIEIDGQIYTVGLSEVAKANVEPELRFG